MANVTKNPKRTARKVLSPEDKFLQKLNAEFNGEAQRENPPKPTNLASRSAQILYGKAINAELLEYKAILEAELSSRGEYQSLALSLMPNSLEKPVSERWGGIFINFLME